ncbi:hypothetical protein [Agrococcus sp. DT81.2]|uniref:CIS tube protein n=1 Tax=Agrococcus sp. DT81.2 TaxID=3393414 RepID=UPI003CE4E464
MTKLEPAVLTRLKDGPASGKKGPSTYVVDERGEKPEFEVQFNPTSLKISRSNNIDKGGSTTNTQKRQAFSAQPATLSFDLEFDTAEEADSSGKPKDVREYTRIVRQFTEPTREKPKDPPPAIRFQWGSFMFQGIVTQLTEDLDYFAPDGTPLRAKVSVTITEQRPEWDAKAVGSGARDAARAARPERTSNGGTGAPSAPSGNGPGTPPSPNPLSTALAQAGESVQQLLTRLNADPATWRSAMAGLDSPLSLSAGTQVQLGATASASAGLGAVNGVDAGAGLSASAGFSAGAAVTASGGVDAGTARAALGIDASASASLGRGGTAEAAAGFVLAEAGGIARASARAGADAAFAAQASARASFEVPAVSASAQAHARASAAADTRSLTYGRGVPLRARVSGDAAATLGE